MRKSILIVLLVLSAGLLVVGGTAAGWLYPRSKTNQFTAGTVVIE